jgi:serine/threonine protein kinase
MAPRSSGTEDTIPASDLDEAAPAGSAPRSSGTEATIPAGDLDDAAPAGSAPRMEAPATAPAAGAEQRYRLGDEIGRGGMGRVVEAYDTQLGRTVALKEVLSSASASLAKRFQREVRITARLEHASIVPLYDAGVTVDGRPYYVMRRVSGRPLDELIMRAKNLEERLALLPNVLAATDAIGHAHRRGVIHRDLKPANILVGDLGETVVIDWGLAKVVGEEEPPPPSFEPPRVTDPSGPASWPGREVPSAGDSLKTQIGSVFGTPGFMAPEQARGDELDPRSDVYALGATLYQLLAGKPPVAGSSATEVIASTMTKRVPSLAKVAPAAPPELATIIDKALSFEADERYPDAGALAEDVRRFLTGQLVAAHRYTRRQRLARFAKRHRAALLVAALAATAVAVLSWVSVHRILTERDAATSARSEAERQRAVADTKAAEARQRADQLLLAHARGLLDASPTEAIAALKHVHSDSPQTLDHAKAIAKAAVARGVAWGVQSLPGATTSFELTRDGKRLLQVSRAGQLQIVDVEHRKQIATFDIGVGTSALWVDGDRKILLDRDKQPPALLDPATRAVDPIGTVALKERDKTAAGDFIGYIDANDHAGIIDIAAKTATVVWTKTAERTVAIAPGAKWLAFGDRVDKQRSRLVVVDRAGKVLVERPGNALITGVSPAGKLAVSLFGEVIELVPGQPAITKLPLDGNEAKLIHQLVYRDEVLQLVGARSLLTWINGRIVREGGIADTLYLAQPIAGDITVVSGNDNMVHLVRHGAHLALPLTGAADGMYRVAAAGTRVAATAKDAILIWDTSSLFPAVVDGAPGVFVGNRRVVVPEVMGNWYVWDVDTHARTQIQTPLEGIPMDWRAEPGENRLLAVVQTARGTAVYGIRADATAELLVEDLGKGRVDIVPGNAIIYSLGKGRIFGKVGSEPSRELATLDGELVSLTANGTLGYAALSTTGELVRGTFGGASFARTQLTDLDKQAFVVADRAASIYIGSGNRLLRWRTAVDEVARFTAPIDFIATSDVGLYVTLASRDVFFVPATGNQTPQRVPVSALRAISRDGKTVVGLSPSQQIELVDMPSVAPWSLPKLLSPLPGVTASPDGQRLVQHLGMQVAVWHITPPGSDFAAWLAELTNATEDDGTVRWPWQP